MTCVCPSERNAQLESYMKQKNIKFRKYTYDELYGEDEIIKRTVQDPEYSDGVLKVVHVDKFDKMWRRSDPFYLDKRNNIEESRHLHDFNSYLKTGQKIYAPNAVLMETKRGPLLTIVDGRHRFATLRDRRLNTVPINFSDKTSAELANKYGLIAA